MISKVLAEVGDPSPPTRELVENRGQGWIGELECGFFQ